MENMSQMLHKLQYLTPRGNYFNIYMGLIFLSNQDSYLALILYGDRLLAATPEEYGRATPGMDILESSSSSSSSPQDAFFAQL